MPSRTAPALLARGGAAGTASPRVGGRSSLFAPRRDGARGTLRAATG